MVTFTAHVQIVQQLFHACLAYVALNASDILRGTAISYRLPRAVRPLALPLRTSLAPFATSRRCHRGYRAAHLRLRRLISIRLTRCHYYLGEAQRLPSFAPLFLSHTARTWPHCCAITLRAHRRLLLSLREQRGAHNATRRRRLRLPHGMKTSTHNWSRYKRCWNAPVTGA